MAIEAKFSEAEIMAISIANAKEIESKCYPWKMKVENSNVYNETMTILENRMSEIQELYECADQGAQALLEQEWVALVSHKDINLRLQFNEENEQIKNQHMKQLYNTLKVIGSFRFTDPKDAVLRRNMAKMFHQVDKYCIRNNVETKGNGNKECLTANQLSMPPPIPPPPPPPPPLLQPFCKPQPKIQTPIMRKTPKTHRNPIATKEQHTRTPLNSLNHELLRSIQHGRALELKRTPFKRSPGGTPLKRQRRLSENDTLDLITIALRRKFQNVGTIASPNENLSPNMRSPSLEFP